KIRFEHKRGWILSSQIYVDPNQKPPKVVEEEDKVPEISPHENKTSVKIGLVTGLPVYHSDPGATIANYATVGTDWKFYINSRHAFDFHAFYAVPSLDSISLTSISNIFSSDSKSESFLTF